MKTVAVVPIKSLQYAKTRLSSALSQQERTSLALEMLAHVLGTLEAAPGISNIAVISPNPGELPLPASITPIVQSRDGLNNLLEQGREWATIQGADALLVAFADLPLLETADIDDIVRLGRQSNTVVLAPDRHGTGTNVMLLHPPTLMPFSFGVASLEKHRASAQEAGAHLEIYYAPGTSIDVDTPDDIAVIGGAGLMLPSNAANISYPAPCAP